MSTNEEFARDDLVRTVRELSDSYEELSLLYRLSETLAGLDVDAICSKILDEAIQSFDLEIAAVMLYDEITDELFTQESRGAWDHSTKFPKNNAAWWQAVFKGRPIALTRAQASEMPLHLKSVQSMLFCPMIGKKKIIGLLIAADTRAGKEFYSNDIKLLSAITRQAALFIENAFLTKEVENFLLGTIRSFVKALEATSLWTAGHTERVTEYSLAIGREMGLDAPTLQRLKICGLLHDIGKIATPREILNKEKILSEEEWDEIRRHPEIGASILEGLEKFSYVAECIKYHHEFYNGENSKYGIRGDDIPLLSRILAVADSFDAMTSDRPYKRKMNLADAVRELETKGGTQFDPDVVRAFTRLIARGEWPFRAL